MSPRPGAASSRAPDRAAAGARAGGDSALDGRVALLCAAYAVITFAFYVIWRHFMAERSADEAIFENLLWNATHGNGLATWIESDGARLYPHLAFHFSPIILLFVPLYALFPSMHVVHLVVCVTTAASGLLVHRLARARLDARASLMVTLAYLLHPTIVLQTFMEFHEQALVALPLLALVAAYERGALVAGLASALVLLGIREDNALLVLAVALITMAARRDFRLGLSLLALVAAWLGLYRWFAVAGLGGNELPGVFAGTYGVWGETPREAVRAILSDPARVASHVLSPTPLRYLAQLLVPFLILAGFGHPLTAAMLPQLFMILLAQHDNRMFEIRLHYSLVPVVLLVVGAIGTMARRRTATLALAGRRIAWPRLISGGMLAVALAGVPLWMGRAVQRLNPRAEEAREVIATVPDTASVTAPGYLLNHMAQRRRIGLSWSGSYTVNEYVIFEEPRPGPPTVDVKYTPEVASALRRAGYVEVHARGGWHVWRRPPP